MVSDGWKIWWGGVYAPNDITPIAWKIPPWMNNDPLMFPFNSGSTLTPCVTTVTSITNMLINANVDAFAN